MDNLKHNAVNEFDNVNKSEYLCLFDRDDFPKWDKDNNTNMKRVENYAKMKNHLHEQMMAFIDNISNFSKYHLGNVDFCTRLFSAGYCYHFAVILKDLFPGGDIYCEDYDEPDYPHVVYIINSIPYDINGVNTSDVMQYIRFDLIPEYQKEALRHTKKLCWNVKQTTKYINSKEVDKVLDEVKEK